MFLGVPFDGEYERRNQNCHLLIMYMNVTNQVNMNSHQLVIKGSLPEIAQIIQGVVHYFLLLGV